MIPTNPVYPVGPAPVVVSGSRAKKKEFEHLRSNYAAWLWLLRDYPLPPFSPPPCLTGPSPTLQLFLDDAPSLALSSRPVGAYRS
jgi:hypothetical protein